MKTFFKHSFSRLGWSSQRGIPPWIPVDYPSALNPLRTIGLIRPQNIFLLKMDKYGLKGYSFYFFKKNHECFTCLTRFRQFWEIYVIFLLVKMPKQGHIFKSGGTSTIFIWNSNIVICCRNTLILFNCKDFIHLWQDFRCENQHLKVWV